MKIGDREIRAFVLVLQETPDRERLIQSHFKEMGVEAEPFYGIHASGFGLRTIHPYERDNPGSGWNMGVKPTGIWISTYMMWAAMSVCPEEYFWELECDCQFPPDWRQRTEAALRSVPKDFDLLYVGSCCAMDNPKTHVSGEIWDVRYPMCTHSIIIAKKALRVLLDTQRKVYAPIDISMTLHTLPKLKVFTVLPSICTQFDTILRP